MGEQSLLTGIDQYKQNLQTFFSAVYGLTVTLSDIDVLHNSTFSECMVVPENISVATVYSQFSKLEVPHFSTYFSLTEKDIQSEQDRPSKTYAFIYKGSANPDTETSGMSYENFIESMICYMTIKEYMLCAQYLWWRDRIEIDTNTVTVTTSVDKNSAVIQCFKIRGTFKIGCRHKTKKSNRDGPRRIMLL